MELGLSDCDSWLFWSDIVLLCRLPSRQTDWTNSSKICRSCRIDGVHSRVADQSCCQWVLVTPHGKDCPLRRSGPDVFPRHIGTTWSLFGNREDHGNSFIGQKKCFIPRNPKIYFGHLCQVTECSTLGSTLELWEKKLWPKTGDFWSN